MAFGISVSLKLEEYPDWLDDELHFVRDGDEIRVEIYRANGSLLGKTRTTIEDFNKMADILLTP
jgi:hypothetical protein